MYIINILYTIYLYIYSVSYLSAHLTSLFNHLRCLLIQRDQYKQEKQNVSLKESIICVTSFEIFQFYVDHKENKVQSTFKQKIIYCTNRSPQDGYSKWYHR